MAGTYPNCQRYLQSATDIADKIAKIDAVIDALLEASLMGGETGNTEEYNLDDGQSKIRQIYRSPEEIAKAIETYEKLKTRYMNKINPQSVVLRDLKSNTL